MTPGKAPSDPQPQQHELPVLPWGPPQPNHLATLLRCEMGSDPGVQSPLTHAEAKRGPGVLEIQLSGKTQNQ